MSNRFPLSVAGRIATDPTLTTGRDGSQRVNFRLAVDDNKQAPDGTWQKDQTIFHNVVAFGKSAEIYHSTYQKGDAVSITGDLKFREFEARDGERAQASEIVANSVAADPRLNTVTIDRSARQTRARSSENSFDLGHAAERAGQEVAADMGRAVGRPLAAGVPPDLHLTARQPASGPTGP